MTDDELKRRLDDCEDGWTERKLENVHRNLVRKTVVAFANSLPEGESAILFIGVADCGQPRGVTNPDQVQKNVREWVGSCYPQVRHNSRVIDVDGLSIVAVIIQTSHNRPHFAGPAFVRIGSESVEASEDMFEELIASRNTKARDLLNERRKGEPVNLVRYFRGYGDLNLRAVLGDWSVSTCSATMATFRSPGGEVFEAEYSHLRLTRTPDGKQLKVEADF